MEKFELSEETTFWLQMFGWTAGCIVLTVVMYKLFAAMVGEAVAKALLAAGVVVVA